MSRMTKFLRQTCEVEAYVETDDGIADTNRFGEIIYAEPVTCKCRNECYSLDFKTSNGAIVQADSRYFLDESFPIKPDYRIDGKVVISVKTYINQLGKVEGYEVYV